MMTCLRKGVAFQSFAGIRTYLDGALALVPSWNELPADVTWFTNLDKESLISKRAFRQNIKHSAYFGLSCYAILEWFKAASLNEESQIRIYSEFCERVLALALKSFPLQSEEELCASAALANYIQDRIFLMDYPNHKHSFELDQAACDIILQQQIASALIKPPIQADEKIPQEISEGAPYYFEGSVDPCAIFEQLVSCKVPSGKWQEIALEKLGVTNKARIDWIVKSPRPVFAQVIVADIYEPLAVVTRNGLRPGARRWMTHHEINVLSGFASLVPERLFVAGRYVSLPGALDAALVPMNHFSSSSLSGGVIALNVMIACATPIKKYDLYLSTSRALWVSAYFRMKSLLNVMSGLHGDGVVHHYGVIGAKWCAPTLLPLNAKDPFPITAVLP